LKVSTTKITSALGKLPELKKMFATLADTDHAGAATNGLGQQFRMFTDGLLGTDGALESRTAGLNSSIARNQTAQDRLDDRATAYEKRVRAQYQALDTQMGTLSSLSNYVTQQMAMLAKN
jgi:flagellar hook-associated protein 2